LVISINGWALNLGIELQQVIILRLAQVKLPAPSRVKAPLGDVKECDSDELVSIKATQR
jgi:hypothetical protein